MGSYRAAMGETISRLQWFATSEDEQHVLLYCMGNDAIVHHRNVFLSSAFSALPALPQIMNNASSGTAALRHIISRTKLLPSFARFVYEVFTICESTPFLFLHPSGFGT
ncbi:hypothetical protein K474DRAFT_1670500 [Panus rudis PR-1116 ss-1]|nr:hypothetical protein K474DRAFT_1670500 [Panus rudis PR-1116 ss-1]